MCAWQLTLGCTYFFPCSLGLLWRLVGLCLLWKLPAFCCWLISFEFLRTTYSGLAVFWFFFDWERSFGRTFEFSYLHKMEHSKKCLGIEASESTVMLTCQCISWSVVPLHYSRKGSTLSSCHVILGNVE